MKTSNQNSALKIYHTDVLINDFLVYIGVVKIDNEIYVVKIDLINEPFFNYFKNIKKYQLVNLDNSNQIFKNVINELGLYFNKEKYELNINIKYLDATPFQKLVWDLLQNVQYGKTITYLDIARKLGLPNYSRAVGNAVGRNPILIKIPCHRVVKSNNTLGGFSSGINNKILLQQLEDIKVLKVI